MVNSTIGENNVLQAHFEGDSYFDRADSNIIHYDIVKHRTRLNIKFDNLKLSIGNSISTSLDTSRQFRITGSLHDLDNDSPLVGEKIKIETDMISNLLFAITNIDGSFNVSDLQAPPNPGHYYVKAMYPENERYYESNSQIDVQVDPKEVDIEELRPKTEINSPINLSGIFVERMDPKLVILERWLTSDPTPSDFEKAVAMLLHLCGFYTVSVGDSYERATLQNRRAVDIKSKFGVDIIALSTDRTEVILCQCSIDWNDDKVMEMLNIKHELQPQIEDQYRSKLFCAVVTRVSENKIYESVRNARQKQVKVVTQEHLKSLMDEVRNNKTPYDMARSFFIA